MSLSHTTEAAALYGSSEPGGTVNLVTKQPSFKPAHAIETYFGSHDYKRLAFDSTGPLNGDGRDTYELRIKYDAKDTYHCQMNGWQSLAAGAQTAQGEVGHLSEGDDR